MKAVFFDRDGTLIDDPGYLSSLNQLVLIENALIFARLCQEAGYLLFVVTNQSGIARGMFDEAFVQLIHEELNKRFAAYGVVIKKYYYCPHHPASGTNSYYIRDCFCRKPQPGMLHTAAHEYGLSLAESLMIGDTDRDLQAGVAAGCVSLKIQDIIKLSVIEMKQLINTFSERSNINAIKSRNIRLENEEKL